MSFEIGQRVVCVDVDFGRKPNWRSKVRLFPELHKVYTIRDICEQDGLAGLYLEEVVNPKAMFGGVLDEPAFDHRRFRPFDRSRLAIFDKILLDRSRDPQKQDELV